MINPNQILTSFFGIVGRSIRNLFIFVLVVILLLNSTGIIETGHRGVLLRFGAFQNVLTEGLYFKIPLIDSVYDIDVRIQKDEMEATAASKDLQSVYIKIAINFQVNPESVGELYQTVGMEYKERILNPILQEAIKAVTARYTAEELITKRENIREDSKSLLIERLKKTGIHVNEFNIVDFNFSASFNEAIEAKVTAEQQALAAKNKLDQIKFEAQQNIEEAKGKAEAIRIESSALQSTPQILEMRAIEKWNGVLPQVTGGATPFINLAPVSQ